MRMLTDQLTSMGALVNFQIFAACEHFAALGKWTWERPLARMHAHMVDELVFCLEGAHSS